MENKKGVDGLSSDELFGELNRSEEARKKIIMEVYATHKLTNTKLNELEEDKKVLIRKQQSNSYLFKKIADVLKITNLCFIDGDNIVDIRIIDDTISFNETQINIK